MGTDNKRWALPSWVVASLLLMVIGAVGPWAKVLVITVHGTDGGRDGWIVIGAAVVAAVGLLFFLRRTRKWLLVFPLLAGGAGIATTAYDISDIHSLAAGSGFGNEFVTVQWGIYVALAGSASLALASIVLLIRPGRRMPEEPAQVEPPPAPPESVATPVV